MHAWYRWKVVSGTISAREDADTTAIVLERNEAYMTSIQARNEAYGVSTLVGNIVNITEADYVSIHSTPDAPNNEDATDPIIMTTLVFTEHPINSNSDYDYA